MAGACREVVALLVLGVLLAVDDRILFGPDDVRPEAIEPDELRISVSTPPGLGDSRRSLIHAFLRRARRERMGNHRKACKDSDESALHIPAQRWRE